MKTIHIQVLTILVFLFSACTNTSILDAKQKLYKNHMDLPDLRDQFYEEIGFKISDLFLFSDNKDFVLKSDALTMIIYELDLNFSVEVFEMDEAEKFILEFTGETDHLNAVHDHYIAKREKSLDIYDTSIKKPIPKKSRFKGVLQTIEGRGAFSAVTITYLIATMHINNRFYVFQMTGKQQNMGYLYDDFLKIIESVKN